jgi:hypothetical protein
MYIIFSLHSQFLLNYSYDRNNHLRSHRSIPDLAVHTGSGQLSMPVHLLALNWSLDQPKATIHRICGDRVQQHGDNYQTLRADCKSHEEVIWMFINFARLRLVFKLLGGFACLRKLKVCLVNLHAYPCT